MSVKIETQPSEQDVIHLHYEGDWTWQEHYDAVQAAKTMMRASPLPRIDLVVHLLGNMLPKGTLSIHFASALRNPAPNLSKIYIVTTNTMVKMLAAASMRINPSVKERYVVVSTESEAENHIARRRPTSTNPMP
jgi:hypothetical protein